MAALEVEIAASGKTVAEAPRRRFGVAVQSAFLTSGLVTCAALVLGLLLYDISSRQLVGLEVERLGHGMQIAEQRLSARFDTARRTVLAAAVTPPVAALTVIGDTGGIYDGSRPPAWRRRLEIIFSGILKANPEYMQIRLIGAADNGQEIVRVDQSDDQIRIVPEAELQQKGSRPYFLDTINLPANAVSFSAFELNQENGTIEVPHRPTVRVATPVVDTRGAYFGIVIINIDARSWFASLAGALPGDSNFYLTDREGDYLVHPDPAKTFGFDLGHRYRITEEFPESTRLFDIASDSRLSAIDDSDVIYLSRLAFDRDDASRFLVLGAVSSREVVLSETRELRDWTLAITLMLVIVTAAVSALLSRLISRPLERVTAAARRISTGDLDTRIEADGTNIREVFDLADAFNRMIDRLRTTLVSRNELAVEVEARKRTAATLRKASRELERKSGELAANIEELEAFTYSVSHDLRAPLRSIDGFSHALEEDYQAQLDDDGRDMIRRIRAATRKMGLLIDDLLNLSRVSRAPLNVADVDLTAMAQEIVSELREASPARRFVAEIEPGLTVSCDPQLVRVVMNNLLHNAWKYSSKVDEPRIEVGRAEDGDQAGVFIRDNGAGFDMAYAGKLFKPFQRLHSSTDFPGTGIGLATVARIVQRHGGRVAARSAPGEGTTFTFFV